MSQGPLGASVAVLPSKALTPIQADAQKVALTSDGGLNAALNVTAAAAIKASAGRLCRIIVINPGTTSGALTLNDAATTGDATTANEIFSIAYNASGFVAGAVYDLQIPVANGIVVSAVPGGGSPQFVVTYN